MSENIDIVLSAFLGDYASKLHVREISRITGMNRQTTSQTLKEMEKSRVMDSAVEGRNKMYFINGRSQKARILVERAENVKKLEICEKRQEIARLVQCLGTSSVALLFGSYAKGTERKESDIDIIFIGGKAVTGTFEKETGKAVHKFEMSERKFLTGLAKKDHMVVEAARNHICLKNAERFVDLMWRANYG